MIALLIVFAVLAAIALLPVGCSARFGETLCIRLVAGPLRFTLYPAGEKPKQKKPKKKKKSTGKTEQKPKKAKLTLSDAKELLPVLQTLLEALDAFRASLRVKLLRIYVTFGGADAAQRGIRYGQAWAVIGGLASLIENVVRVKDRDLQALYDPEAEGFALEGEVCATLQVWQILRIALWYGLRALRQFLKTKKQKAVQTNESSSS